MSGRRRLPIATALCQVLLLSRSVVAVDFVKDVRPILRIKGQVNYRKNPD